MIYGLWFWVVVEKNEDGFSATDRSVFHLAIVFIMTIGGMPFVSVTLHVERETLGSHFFALKFRFEN